MFDPSKLDLNLDGKDNIENTNKKPEEINKNEEKSTSEDNSVTTTSKKDENEVKESEQTGASAQVTQDDKTIEDISDKKEEKTEKIEKAEEKEIIYDVNVGSVSDLVNILTENSYDFVIIEPSEKAINLSFRKNSVEKESRFVKYPIYTDILLKAKSLTKLKVDTTSEKQEGSGEINIKDKVFMLSSKVVPGPNGEKLFLKVKLLQKKVEKSKEKVGAGKIFAFLLAVLFASLVVGGVFLGFILMNSSSVEDLVFFKSMGIDVGSIKAFTEMLVNVVFIPILFIESILLFIFVFKALLTKKQEKQKKIFRMIMSVFLIIILLISSFAWIFLTQKIKDLKNPNYGEIEFYDNDKLVKSETLKINATKIDINDNLIGPVSIRFKLKEFIQKLKDDGFTPEKIIWIFEEEEIEKAIEDADHIRVFDEKGPHEVKVQIVGKNIKGEDETLPVDIATVSISNVVKIEERESRNGGKLVEFDASSFSNLGRILWYMSPSWNEPVWEGTSFIPGKPIFDETIVGMKIVSSDGNTDEFDKVFIITPGDENNIEGEIAYSRGVINDLEFEFSVKNIENEFGEGFIEEFLWEIEDKTFVNKGEIDDQEGTSKITYEFDSYGEKEIKVTLTNSDGKEKVLNLKLDIPKKIKLLKNLDIFNDDILLEEVEYDSGNNEYYLSDIGVPTTMRFDASNISQDDILYTLDKSSIQWDYDSDGNIDHKGEDYEKEINVDGNHEVSVTYYFNHRRKIESVLKLTEKIFISGEKKDAILNIKVDKQNNYVPAVIGFDASRSKVLDDDIVSFEWDYGDGVVETSGAVIEGHKYTKAGTYIVKLKVITEKGKEYTKETKLVLIPKPQGAKITTSLKKAPIYQGIDFSSSESVGQISQYFWDFGDGKKSLDANPSHMYEKPGIYTVKLKLDFANNSVGEAEVKIEITDE